MALDWWSGSKASLEELIAKKKYGKAIEILRAQFQQGSRDPRLRMQLADVLTLGGKGREAVPILVGLADEYAMEGFAAKAIAVLKKVEKIEAGRQDVAKKLAALIDKQKEATGAFLLPSAKLAMRAPELGIEEIHEAPAEIALQIETRSTPAPPPAPAPPTPTAELQIEEEGMDEAAFDLELHALIEQNVLPPMPTASGASTSSSGAHLSPLFSDFTQDELLAVIQGLDLLTFEPGDVIVSEGEPGDSLFILTTGLAKVFVRSPSGRNVKVREMPEGSFFGEVSILSGKPRSATVTAAAACELLELDRKSLDKIVASHRRVIEVLQRFYKQRMMSAEDEKARQSQG